MVLMVPLVLLWRVPVFSWLSLLPGNAFHGISMVSFISLQILVIPSFVCFELYCPPSFLAGRYIIFDYPDAVLLARSHHPLMHTTGESPTPALAYIPSAPSRFSSSYHSLG